MKHLRQSCVTNTFHETHILNLSPNLAGPQVKIGYIGHIFAF